VSISCQTEDSELLVVRVPENVEQTLEEVFCVMEETVVSAVCLCAHKNKTNFINNPSPPFPMTSSLLSVIFVYFMA
jgi:hypothetical protein